MLPGSEASVLSSTACLCRYTVSWGGGGGGGERERERERERAKGKRINRQRVSTGEGVMRGKWKTRPSIFRDPG